MKGERSAFQLNAEIAARPKTQLADSWKKRSAEEKRQLVSETIHSRLSLRESTPVRGAKGDDVGRIERDGYTIHKLVLTPEPGSRLPALAFEPARPPSRSPRRGARSRIAPHGDACQMLRSWEDLASAPESRNQAVNIMTSRT
jgi:hypothetical protein